MRTAARTARSSVSRRAARRPVSRRAGVAVVAVLLVASAAACTGGGSAAAPRSPDAAPSSSAPRPSASPDAGAVASVAAVGDSITLGVNACDEPGPCLDDSWALGTAPGVDSFATRLGGSGSARPATLPFAMEGATVGEALDHVQEIVDRKPDVVTVLLGANDACARTFDDMTSAEEFAASMTTLLQELADGLPDATLLAMSVPDLNQIWELGKDDPDAVGLWSKSPSCRSLLWHADSTSSDDAARRAAVDQRVRDFNAAIATACTALPTCVSDGGALHDVRFAPEDMSSIDHFHPSATGQARIAEVAWQAWTAGQAAAGGAG
ncbi:SGNH/GDSL hydrolase family protein [Xylanimonas protaetiae]|uniref:SGNH/GDSL hydrolase family protein n=1 Tax=Xylanimonas protaetiae TaxID=2509457 RepID=A0A4P6F2V3_9MICO|nr:GDSL-type esterase/lipase family protein [Xylanimonas protaetiae]QAY69505.1 SGNH/GDSL hydrolase family protein [Xylanimonas protaetiae]